MFFAIEPASLFPYQGGLTPLEAGEAERGLAGAEAVSEREGAVVHAAVHAEALPKERVLVAGPATAEAAVRLGVMPTVAHVDGEQDVDDAPVAAAQAAPLAASCEVPRVGIGVFVIRPDGQFIVGERNDSRSLGYKTIAVPGGHLEMNESFQACAHRELLEETGIDIPEAHFEFMTAVDTIFAEQGKHYVTIFMGGPAPYGAKPKLLEPDKCTGWHWTKWDDFKKQERRLFTPLVKLIRERPTFRPGAWVMGAPARRLMLDL